MQDREFAVVITSFFQRPVPPTGRMVCQSAGGQEVPSDVVLHTACSAVRYDCHTEKHNSKNVSSSLLDTHQLSSMCSICPISLRWRSMWIYITNTHAYNIFCHTVDHQRVSTAIATIMRVDVQEY